MKKLFYFACASLLALGTVSCDDDDEAPARSLSATPGTLTFTATPDTPKTIDVKAENVSWKATTEAGWLTLKNAEGTADGTVTGEATRASKHRAIRRPTRRTPRSSSRPRESTT